MKSRIFLFAILIFAVSLVSVTTSAQRKPGDDKPITGDFKIIVKTEVAGQSTQSTEMIKGTRERTETSTAGGSGSVNIIQCDMRRTIQVNDTARKYLVTPMDVDSSASDDTSTVGAPPTSAVQRGGVVNVTVNTVDTGERKEMFGFTARHLKRTAVTEPAAGACNQQRMKVETDGWYINLEYGLSCPTRRPPQTRPGTTSASCHDRYVSKITGPATLGYPLMETTTLFGPEYGGTGFTITKQVIELSRQTLDAALFDIPAGYAEAKSLQEMYSPSITDNTATAPQQEQASAGNRSDATGNTPSAARIRVGVVNFNNKTKTSASTDSLRDQLVAALSAKGIDAVALNAISPSEAATEAQAKRCSYILYTDIATLKAPSAGKKLGGMFGRATGVGSADAGKAEVKLDFRLVKTGSPSPVTQSSASEKQETQEGAVNSAIQGEAQAVADAIPRS